MDPKELRGLVEAYSEVYAPEQLDEISAGLAGKVVNARIAATGAASDRAYKHRNPEAMRAAEKASDKEGRARKLAAGVRSRRAKQNEEFELWVNELVEEGHDLSDYTWDEVYEFYLDEASSRDEFTRAAIARSSGRKGGITFEPGPNWDASANRGKGAHISPKQKEKQRRKALRQEAFEDWLDEAMTNYEKNRKRAAQRAAARNDARAQGKTGAVPGVGYVTPRKERETWTDESGKTRHAKGL